MGKRFSLKGLVRWSDVVVVAIFLSVVAYLFFHSRPQIPWLEAQMHPDQVKEIVLQQVSGTPLDPGYNPKIFSHRFKTFRVSFVGWLSEMSFSNRFVHYFNTLQSWVADCSSCSDEEVCADLEKEILPYPDDINNKRLKELLNGNHEVMIVDVREFDQFSAKHIQGSINLPLLELVDWIFPTNRWTEIVIVGDSYYQTKIAVETLRRLNFHRLFRLMTPVDSWNGDFDSFL